MKTQNNTYSFSFTAASSLMQETVVVAENYIETESWDETYSAIVNENLLHKVKEATIKREFSEIEKRLDTLTGPQLQLLVSGTREDAQAMVHLAISKTYVFISDFIMEVVRNKYLSGDRLLLESDYKNFLESKIGYHPELRKISPITTAKIKQVLLKILSQNGFLSSPRERNIMRPMLSRETITVIKQEDINLLKLFIYSDIEIERLIG